MDKQFEEAYSKTTYYRIHYKDTGLNAFSWNEENKRYVWNDVQCSWEVWQEAQKQAIPDGYVLVPTVPSERMVLAVRQCYEGEHYLPYSLYSEFINQAIIERMEAQEQAND